MSQVPDAVSDRQDGNLLRPQVSRAAKKLVKLAEELETAIAEREMSRIRARHAVEDFLLGVDEVTRTARSLLRQDAAKHNRAVSGNNQPD